MITSEDIARSHSAQTNMFNNQWSFAQRIGASYSQSGLQAFGGASAPPGGGFNFGKSSIFNANQYGSGTRFGAGVMSATTGLAQGAVTAADVGLGAAGMMGAGPLAGAGLMGGLVAPLGLAIGAGAAIGAVGTGAQQNSQFNQMMGQNFSNFYNPMSRTGAGFTREDAGMIRGGVRELSHVPEMMSSFEELTKIVGRLRGMNLTQGVTQASEFSTRIKEALTTVRSLAEVLGTTMEDATEFFKHSSSVGLHGPTSNLRNALAVQMTSGLTGLQNAQVMGVQAGGAAMATQMGAQRGHGAAASTRLAATIGLAQRQGLLDSSTIQNITGLEGPEGIAALAQQTMASMSQFMLSSPIGELVMAGLVTTDSEGRATIDQKKLEAFRRGEIGRSELTRNAQNLTNEQKISFKARRNELAMQLAGDAGAMSQAVGGIMEPTFGKEGTTYILGQYGISSQMSDAMRSMRGVDPEEDASQFTIQQAITARRRKRTDIGGAWKRIKTKAHTKLFGGLEKFGDELQDSLSESFDNWIDDFMGRYVVEISKEGIDKFRSAMTGTGKQDMEELFRSVTFTGDGTGPGGVVGKRFSGVSKVGGLELPNEHRAPIMDLGRIFRKMGDSRTSEDLNDLSKNLLSKAGTVKATPDVVKFLDESIRQAAIEAGGMDKLRDMNAIERQEKIVEVARGRVTSGLTPLSEAGIKTLRLATGDSSSALLDGGLEAGISALLFSAKESGAKTPGMDLLPTQQDIRGQGGGNYDLVKNAALKERDARAALKSLEVSDDVKLMLKSSRKRKAMIAALKDKYILEGFSGGNPKLLKEFKLSSKEAKQIADAAYTYPGKGVENVIEQLDKAEHGGNIVGLADMMKIKGAVLQKSLSSDADSRLITLAGEMADISTGSTSEKDVMDMFNKVRSTFSEVAEEYSSLLDGGSEDRKRAEDLLAKAGGFAPALATARRTHTELSQMKGSQSIEDITTRIFGRGAGSLERGEVQEALGFGKQDDFSKTKLTLNSGQIDKLSAMSAELRQATMIVGKEKVTVTATLESVKTAMEKISKNMDQVGAIFALSNADNIRDELKKGNSSSDDIEKLFEKLRDKAAAIPEEGV